MEKNDQDYSGRQFIKDSSLVSRSRLRELAGMSLQTLLDYHMQYLIDVYIPNWDRAVDRKHGGFANVAIPDRNLDFEKKDMYYQARAIWMFSYLYNHITHDQRHLDAAIQGRDFVVKHALMQDSQWASFVSREGRQLSGSLDHYGDIYMVMGLAELYRATKAKRDIEMAIETAKSVMVRLLSPSYQHIQAHIDALEPGTRRLPSWQHLLYSLTLLLQVHHDTTVGYMARYCVRIICECHWQPQKGVLLEVLDDRFRPYTFDAPNWGDFKPRGVHGWHSIQACWMVMDEALRTKHYPTYRQGVEMGIATLGKCYVDGRGIAFDNRGFTIAELTNRLYGKVTYPWGALDDMLVYCLMVLEHSHEPFAINYYNKCFKLYNSQPDQVVTSGLLHTPRRFFHTIRILERMIARGGDISGLFG